MPWAQSGTVQRQDWDLIHKEASFEYYTNDYLLSSQFTKKIRAIFTIALQMVD